MYVCYVVINNYTIHTSLRRCADVRSEKQVADIVRSTEEEDRGGQLTDIVTSKVEQITGVAAGPEHHREEQVTGADTWDELHYFGLPGSQLSGTCMIDEQCKIPCVDMELIDPYESLGDALRDAIECTNHPIFASERGIPDSERAEKQTTEERATEVQRSPGSEVDCSMREEAVDKNSDVRRSRCRRLKDKNLWKAEIRKRRRNSGQSYVMRSGTIKRARIMKPGCGPNCRYKCHKNVSDEQRQKLFHEFWKLGDLNNQRHYLAMHVVKTPKVTSAGKQLARRLSLKYSFHVAGNVMSVCKTFFLATLGTSERTVFTTLSKVTPDGHVTPKCRHMPESRRIPEQEKKRSTGAH